MVGNFIKMLSGSAKYSRNRRLVKFIWVTRGKYSTENRTDLVFGKKWQNLARSLKNLIIPSAVNQEYLVDVFRTTVINGNDALLKCDIPSFVTDFIEVSGWVDSEGTTILPGADENSKF